MIEESSKKKVYVSVIGVGIDFNTELTDSITKHEGSNYFCITKDAHMKEVIIDHFHYNFFPSAFNCLLRIESDLFEVVRTYGISYIIFSQFTNLFKFNFNFFQILYLI